MSTPLLEIRNAAKVYGGGLLGGGQGVAALQDCSLSISGDPAVITTVAGESGSGKTTLAGAVLGFVKLTSGQVFYQGQDVALMNGKQRFEYRRQVQAVFQDPYAAFNPFYRAGHVFDLALRCFGLAANKAEARDRVEEALGKVGLLGEEVLAKYPHQLSGGQRQRMLVARAYLMTPRLIVADEPVSMVDASLRSMILDIMLRLRDEAGISFLYITHDLSTAYQVSDDISIFYRGALVETGHVEEVLRTPKHPYTQLLIDSIPLPDPGQKWASGIDLSTTGEDDATLDAGCCFYSRCPKRIDRCRTESPPYFLVDGPDHKAACYLYEGMPDNSLTNRHCEERVPE